MAEFSSSAGTDKELPIGEIKEGDDDKWASPGSEQKEADIPRNVKASIADTWDDAVCTLEDAPQPMQTKSGGEKAVVHYKASAPAVFGNIAVMTGLKLKRALLAVVNLSRSAASWITRVAHRRKNQGMDSKIEVPRIASARTSATHS